MASSVSPEASSRTTSRWRAAGAAPTSSVNRSEAAAQQCSNICRSTATMAGLRRTMAEPGLRSEWASGPSGGTMARVWSTMISFMGTVAAVRTSPPSLTMVRRWARTCGTAAAVARWIERIAMPRLSASRLRSSASKRWSSGSALGCIERMSVVTVLAASSRIAAIWEGWAATSMRASASCRMCTGWNSDATWLRAVWAWVMVLTSSSVRRRLPSISWAMAVAGECTDQPLREDGNWAASPRAARQRRASSSSSRDQPVSEQTLSGVQSASASARA
ncbi:hypothetical protein ABZZ36_07655 [Actinacidiphila glaucinigra]|uniref:hypothetical protein n=1 Tax=Actinacidiphila glaucinigra TaxID=235986 RepID=UPI0033A87D15